MGNQTRQKFITGVDRFGVERTLRVKRDRETLHGTIDFDGEAMAFTLPRSALREAETTTPQR